MYGSPCAQLIKLLPLTDFIDRVSVFLPTAETLCSTDCATVCWEDIPRLCGPTPPAGMRFVRGGNLRPVDDGSGNSVQICPGSLLPANEEECRELGARHSFDFGGVIEERGWAPGCFNHAEYFYYNTHPIGTRGAAGPLWCKDRAATGEHRHHLSISWKCGTCLWMHVCVVACAWSRV
jgi:hypothetical protein